MVWDAEVKIFPFLCFMDPNIKISFWDTFLLLFLLRSWLIQQKLPRGGSSLCSGLLSEPFLAADQWDFSSHFPVLCLFISYIISFVELASFFFWRLNACFLYGGCFLMVGIVRTLVFSSNLDIFTIAAYIGPDAALSRFAAFSSLLFVPSCLYCGMLVDNSQVPP